METFAFVSLLVLLGLAVFLTTGGPDDPPSAGGGRHDPTVDHAAS